MEKIRCGITASDARHSVLWCVAMLVNSWTCGAAYRHTTAAPGHESFMLELTLVKQPRSSRDVYCTELINGRADNVILH